MKKLFRVSVSKMYVVYLLLLTTFVIGTYSSYAYFTVNKEKKNAVKMVTGNLVGELKIDDVVSDKLVVNAGETKTFKVELYNKNNRQARFNFYYKGSLPDKVEAGYVMGDGINNMPQATGVNLTAEGMLGYFVRFQIKVVNNTSGSVTIPLGYEVGLDYNDLSLPDNCYLFEETQADPKSAVDALLVNYTNSEDIQNYDVYYTKEDASAKENKMYVFNHTAGTQQTDWTSDELKSYRYIGKDPNNYVLFNEEMWRIIGIETVDDGTGTKEKRIKLIKNDPLPIGTNNDRMAWDNKPNGTGSSDSRNGSNNWADSRLMYLLNPHNESQQTGVSGSIYWNRQKGSCPHEESSVNITNGTIDCDFSEVGLLSEAQAMIGKAKWFLGGTNSYNSYSNGLVTHWYSYERGTNVYNNNPTYWIGEIGLLYPSDFGYATGDGRSSSSRSNRCYNSTTLYNWNGGCQSYDWLAPESLSEWFITTRSGMGGYTFGHVYNSVSSLSVAEDRSVRPTIYLKADILYKSGDGSSSNPFVFASPTSSDQGMEN